SSVRPVETEILSVGSTQLNVPGTHNFLTAVGALSVCVELGLYPPDALGALSAFRGVRRRFEKIGERHGVTVVSDYAHHPTEIEAGLEAAGSGGWERVVCFFQPHRFSRTKLLLERFGESFEAADVLFLTDIYPAGEEPVPGISGRLLADRVRRASPEQEVHYVPRLKDAAAELAKTLNRGDLLLLLGAGDIPTFAGHFLEAVDQAHLSRR
ncbi:MAG: glutamate ligase domain-containing protein, partial [Terriglobia bacterium]